ncbi:hypothetical protein HJFPF1_01166 [Paramyrothecium foliicola]|nr:hypothetical protein HJFPF1_01166 [Paramyrothecium foliicola]
MEPRAPEWDLDSDEIASVASDELHENRPNRWTGPKSTWRTLTAEERLLWQSLKQLRDQDLAAHLYNAFALKKRGRNPETAPDLLVQTEDGQEAVWAPPKIWTAWPLKERHVPPEGLIKKMDDEDEQFTFRKKEQVMPSTELEAELSAIILGQAKDRFLKRQRKAPAPLLSIETAIPFQGIQGSSQQLPPLGSSAPASPSEVSVDERERMDMRPPFEMLGKAAEGFEPVVSANDDMSFGLLRPSVRHILSQLDKTLTILHNSRVAGLGYLSDSTTEDESDSGTPRKKKKRGRPRTAWQYSGTTSPDSRATTPKATTRRGRPRKVHLPQEGESHDDMLHRVARESHRRLPLLAKEMDAAFEEWMRQGEQQEEEASRAATPQSAAGPDVTDEGEEPHTLNVEKKLARWGMRDWSDVLGAAALAGFPRDAIARATKRCADLFGESMVMRHLDEVPMTRGTGMHNVEYCPEPIRLSSEGGDSDDSMDDDETRLRHRRIASRRASLARSSQGSESGSPSISGRVSRAGRSPRTHSRSQSQSRSRSRSRSAAGQFFCPVTTCERAASGFTRRANLTRHVQLVHGGDGSVSVSVGPGGGGGSGGGTLDTDNDGDGDDEDEEFVGAVHVDGFLRPIVPGRGWRGEDTVLRKRKGYYADRRFTGRSPRSRRTSEDEGDSSS